jgi:Na+-translocating ferredoxin:NAD+ oxidoreductase subunit G
MTPAGSPAPAPNQPGATRLLGTLGIAGALAGLLIVLVYGWAHPRILEHRERALESAVHEVLGGPASVRTLWLQDGAVHEVQPAGRAERIFLGLDAAGRPAGFAVQTGKAGFQDVIGIIFGYDAREDRVLGMKVLESTETPGLGDRIEKDAGWIASFRGVRVPIRIIKPGTASGGDDEVATITGATISTRTVIEAINLAIERHGAALAGYVHGSGQ